MNVVESLKDERESLLSWYGGQTTASLLSCGTVLFCCLLALSAALNYGVQQAAPQQSTRAAFFWVAMKFGSALYTLYNSIRTGHFRLSSVFLSLIYSQLSSIHPSSIGTTRFSLVV